MQGTIYYGNSGRASVAAEGGVTHQIAHDAPFQPFTCDIFDLAQFRHGTFALVSEAQIPELFQALLQGQCRWYTCKRVGSRMD